MKKFKQVLVIRKDLNMRKGKMVSQGSHSSLGVFEEIMSWERTGENQRTYSFTVSDEIGEGWFDGDRTKITVSVNSEEELKEVYNKAKEKGILCSLITDLGHTEFNGVPTLTACCIGPHHEDEINEITGNLKLL